MNVEDALRLPVLGHARLLTDPETASGRDLTWVSVIEVPVGKFVRSGEFVLSTGMGIGHNPILFARFIRAVAKAGAAALGIAIGPHTPSLPKQAVTAANRLGLPLIEIPWEIRFSEISEAIVKRLLSEQAALQEKAAMRSRDDFVWSLASGSSTRNAVAAQGKRFGYDPAERYIAVAGKLARPADERFANLESQLRSVEHLCGKAASDDGLHWIGTIAADSVVGYVQMPRKRERIPAILATVQSVARQKDAISWGIGRLCEDFADFRKSYEDAVLACEMGIRTRGEGLVTDVSDVLADKLILSLRSDADALALLSRYIEPLKQISRPPLLSTLEAFFESDCNVSRTARKLSISRQSLFYRVGKIEALLNADLHAPETRFALSLSLRLHKLRNIP